MKRFGLDVSCVYVIVNLRNGKRYIGSTVNFSIRSRTHRVQLRRGTHDNRYLQAAWRKYGEDAFVFGIVEYVPANLLSDKEQHYLDAAQPNVYNIGTVAASPNLGRKATPKRLAQMRDSKHSKETIATMRQSAIDRHASQKAGFAAFTKEQKEYWYKACRPSWAARIGSPMQGHKHSAETIAKMVAVHRGRKRSEETKAKLKAAWVRRRTRLKMHCKHGHEFSHENTAYVGTTRVCRTCKRLNHAIWLINSRPHAA